MKFPVIRIQVHILNYPQSAKQWKKIFSGFIHFMTFICNFGSGVYFDDPPPIGQAVKTIFSGFIHFIKFPAILVQLHILTPPSIF